MIYIQWVLSVADFKYTNLNIIVQALTGCFLIGSVRFLDLNTRGRISRRLMWRQLPCETRKTSSKLSKDLRWDSKEPFLIYQHVSAWWSRCTSLLIIPSLSLKSILSLFHVFPSTIIATLSSGGRIPPPSPADALTRGLIPAPSSSKPLGPAERRWRKEPPHQPSHQAAAMWHKAESAS